MDHSYMVVLGFVALFAFAVPAMAQSEHFDGIKFISKGIETTADRMKTASYPDGLKLLSESDVSCVWKPDGLNDGYKSCTAIIEIRNDAIGDKALELIASNFVIEFNKGTTLKDGKISYRYSVDGSKYNKEIIADNATKKMVERTSWGKWKELDGLITLKSGKSMAIEAIFEIPQYESVNFSFGITTADKQIDPAISACGVISSAGVYTLTNNIDGYGGATCFDVQASNVILDGQNFNVSSPGTDYFVWASGRSNVTVKNFNVNASPTYFISFYNTNSSSIQNVNKTTSGSIYGITVDGGHNNSLSDISVSITTHVMRFDHGASGNNLSRVRFIGGGCILLVYDAANFKNNLVWNNFFNTTGGGDLFCNVSGSIDSTNLFYNAESRIGNYWGNTTLTEFSDTCTNADSDAFCDDPFNPMYDVVDLYPLNTTSVPYTGAGAPGLDIITPTNTTFYNLSFYLGVSNTSNLHTFWFVVNSTNVTYFPPYTPPNGTYLSAPTGSFNLTVYANNSAGTATYKDTVFFSVRAYQIIYNYSEVDVLETKTTTYNLSVYDWSSGVIPITASLILPNQTITPTVLHSGNYYNFSVLTIPSYLSGEANASSVSWWWNLTVNSADNSSSVHGSQTVNRLRILPCNPAMGNRTINFSITNASDAVSPIMASLEGYFRVYVDSGNRTYSYSQSGAYNYTYCIYPGWATYNLDSIITYTNGSTTNTYITQRQQFNNQTTQINLLMPSGATLVTITAYNNIKVPQSEVVITARKLYPATGVYQTAAQGQTGYDGTVTMTLEIGAFYQWIIQRNGVTIATIPSFQLNSVSQSLYISQNYVAFFDYINSISYSCNPDNTTYHLTCTVSDLSGLMTYSSLKVKKWFPNNYTQTVCSLNSTSSSATFDCDLSVYNTSQLTYVFSGVFGTSSPTTQLFVDGSLWGGNTPLLDLGLMGVFLSFCIVITLFFAGMQNSPTTAMVLGCLGIVVSQVVGLLNIGFLGIAPVILVAAVIIYKLED